MYFSELLVIKFENGEEGVLILIVLDVLLWAVLMQSSNFHPLGLNPYCIGCTSLSSLWVAPLEHQGRLNPYCIGCTSLSVVIILVVLIFWCLNPYCIGCTSLRWRSYFKTDPFRVLILIVLDVLLWVKTTFSSHSEICVLILIVLDVLLWGTVKMRVVLI